ncbi:MAG: hypothetical protein DRI83_09140 [Bacteroidetes bacterium]|nr:MAG: hypothetical protein DRI83_09140 [Bacteroidota bacterium]
MDIDTALERIKSRVNDIGIGASFTYDEVSEWMKISSGDDLMWAFDKLSDRLTKEHSLRLELEEDRLIVAVSDFNDIDAAEKRK